MKKTNGMTLEPIAQNQATPGTVQMPMTQAQVQALIGGVLYGYNELQGLNKTYNGRNVESEIFIGSVNISVANNMYLGEILQNLFSLRVTTPLMVNETISHYASFEGKLPSSRQISAFEKRYAKKMDKAVSNIVSYAEEQKALVKERTDRIRHRLLDLERTVELKDNKALTEALEELSAISSWDSRIELKPLYEAAQSIRSLAGFNAEFIPEAQPLVERMGTVIAQSKVAPVLFFHPWSGRPVANRWVRRLVPEQTYTGPVDLGIVADEMLRNSSGRMDGQKSSFEVNPKNN